MSKRSTPDAPYKPPRQCVTTERNTHTQKDMDRVITLLEEIKDSIELLLDMYSLEQPEERSEEDDS